MLQTKLLLANILAMSNYLHGFSPLYSPFGLGAGFTALLILALLWTVILKGFALWHAARSGQKAWFIAILIVNTLGILEVVYLLFFCPKTSITGPSAPVSSTPTV